VLLFFVVSCSKKEAIPEPPVTVDPSVVRINSLQKVDLNDVKVDYTLTPPLKNSIEREFLMEIYLQWSEDPQFSKADSFYMFTGTNVPNTYQYTRTRLKDGATLHFRFAYTYKNVRFYSASQSESFDSLRLVKYPKYISRGADMLIQTNFLSGLAGDTSTRIYLNDMVIPHRITNGEFTFFNPSWNLDPGKYRLRFERNGIGRNAPDSVEVLRGIWYADGVLPFPYPSGKTAIAYYGACYTATKGYLVPGGFFTPNSGTNYATDIFEFNPRSAGPYWSPITPVNPRSFDRPQVQYHNNALYVLGGRTYQPDGRSADIDSVFRFDLASKTWENVGPIPYKHMNTVSFKHGDYFYMGLGQDIENPSQCCGFPQPSNTFYRYEPASGSWTKLADLPATYDWGRYGGQLEPTVALIGNKAYVLFAAKPAHMSIPASAYTREMWEYDIVGNSWRQIALPPEDVLPPAEKYSMVSYLDKLYILTGERYTLGVSFYFFQVQKPCIEFQPTTGQLARITVSDEIGLLKPVFQEGTKFYFQGDGSLGRVENIIGKTFTLSLQIR
jgi:hypothetical protein